MALTEIDQKIKWYDKHGGNALVEYKKNNRENAFYAIENSIQEHFWGCITAKWGDKWRRINRGDGRRLEVAVPVFRDVRGRRIFVDVWVKDPDESTALYTFKLFNRDRCVMTLKKDLESCHSFSVIAEDMIEGYKLDLQLEGKMLAPPVERSSKDSGKNLYSDYTWYSQ